MRAVRGVGHGFRKVAFSRIRKGQTRPLPVRINAVQHADEDVPAGLEDLLWLLSEGEEDKWLIGNVTSPMKGRQDEDIGPLGTRICDCEVMPGVECCCPVR